MIRFVAPVDHEALRASIRAHLEIEACLQVQAVVEGRLRQWIHAVLGLSGRLGKERATLARDHELGTRLERIGRGAFVNARGPCRFYFYSHEPREPRHIHVDRDQADGRTTSVAEGGTRFVLEPAEDPW